MKYNSKYNWEEQEVKKFLTKIYNNSLQEVNNENIAFSSFYKETIETLVNFVEEYLYIAKKNYNLTDVLIKLECIDKIKFVNDKNLAVKNSNKIVFSQELYSNFSDNSKRLVVYYNLSNYLLNFKSQEAIDFSRHMREVLNSNICDQVMANHGWLLFEEAMAREITRRFINIYNRNEGNTTILDEELDLILVIFGLTLNKVDSNNRYSKESIKDDLVNMAFKTDFTNEVLLEYKARGWEQELYDVLCLMGKFYNKKDNRFPYLQLIDKEYYQVFNKLLEKILLLVSSLKKQETIKKKIKEK